MQSLFQRIGILGHVGNQNLGDEAIIAATILNLREYCPAVDIVAFTSNPEDTRQRHRIPAFPLRRDSSGGAVTGNLGNAEGSNTLQSLINALKRIPIVYPALKGVRNLLSVVRGAIEEIPFLASSYRRVKGLDLLIVAGSQQLNDFAGV